MRRRLKRWMVLVTILLMGIGFYNTTLAEEVLIINSSFEEANEKTGELANWSYDEWQKTEMANFSIHKGDAKSGDYFVSITHLKENDTRLIQKVNVEENTTYKLSVWAKAVNIPEEHIGANISILEAHDIPNHVINTNDKWQYLEQIVTTDDNQTEMTIALRLGFYGNVTEGMVAFDDVKVEKIGSVTVQQNEAAENNQGMINGNNIIIFILLIGLVFVLQGIIVKKKFQGKSLKK